MKGMFFSIDTVATATFVVDMFVFVCCLFANHKNSEDNYSAVNYYYNITTDNDNR